MIPHVRGRGGKTYCFVTLMSGAVWWKAPTTTRIMDGFLVSAVFNVVKEGDFLKAHSFEMGEA